MVDPFRGVPYGFGALPKTFGPLSGRSTCGATSVAATRTSTWPSCETSITGPGPLAAQCAAPGAALTVTDPTTVTGMGDYRLDQRDRPERHPRTVDRLTGNRRRSSVDQASCELPGRKIDPRR
jgi:hypothetical protein